jgi:hypothetical protein
LTVGIPLSLPVDKDGVLLTHAIGTHRRLSSTAIGQNQSLATMQHRNAESMQRPAPRGWGSILRPSTQHGWQPEYLSQDHLVSNRRRRESAKRQHYAHHFDTNAVDKHIVKRMSGDDGRKDHTSRY